MSATDEPEERYLRKLIEDSSKTEDRLSYSITDQNKSIYQYIVDSWHAIFSEKEHKSDKKRTKNDIVKLIKTDEEAIETIGNVCENLVRPEGSKILNFYFTKDINGESTGADFHLLLAMGLVNRGGLLHLFFTRQCLRDAASTLPNALWICLISKQLSKHSSVGNSSYHLQKGLEVRAAIQFGIVSNGLL